MDGNKSTNKKRPLGSLTNKVIDYINPEVVSSPPRKVKRTGQVTDEFAGYLDKRRRGSTNPSKYLKTEPTAEMVEGNPGRFTRLRKFNQNTVDEKIARDQLIAKKISQEIKNIDKAHDSFYMPLKVRERRSTLEKSKKGLEQSIRMLRGYEPQSIQDALEQIMSFGMATPTATATRCMFEIDFPKGPIETSTVLPMSNEDRREFMKFLQSGITEFSFSLAASQQILNYKKLRGEELRRELRNSNRTQYEEELEKNVLDYIYSALNVKNFGYPVLLKSPFIELLSRTSNTISSVVDIPFYFIFALKKRRRGIVNPKGDRISYPKPWTYNIYTKSFEWEEVKIPDLPENFVSVEHVLCVILYKGKLYSIGAGYLGTKASLYSPDFMFEFDVPEYRKNYVPIDVGILNKKHLERIIHRSRTTTRVHYEFDYETVKSQYVYDNRRFSNLDDIPLPMQKDESYNDYYQRKRAIMSTLYQNQLQENSINSKYVVLSYPRVCFGLPGNYRRQISTSCTKDNMNCTSFMVDIFREEITCSTAGVIHNPGLFGINCRKINGKKVTLMFLQTFIKLYKENRTQQLLDLLMDFQK